MFRVRLLVSREVAHNAQLAIPGTLAYGAQATFRYQLPVESPQTQPQGAYIQENARFVEELDV